MAGDGKLLLLGGAAAAAYWFWIRPQTAAPPAAGGAPAGGGGGAPTGGGGGGGAAAPPPAAPPPAAPPNPFAAVKLADIYTKFNQAAQAAGVDTPAGLGPDEYDFYLTQTMQSLGLPDPSLPDPVGVFGPSGWARPQTMSVSAYWGPISSWLKANKGMSGFDLSSVPWYGWAAAAGLGVMALSAKGR